MTKHTPGPWNVGYRDNQCVYSGGKHVATVQCFVKQWVANARLIAAAPELLAAATSAENWLTEYEQGPDTGLRGLLTQLREAIAKAEGGAG